MQPQIFIATHVGDRRNRIDCPRAGRAGRGNHGERAVPGRAIAFDARRQGMDIQNAAPDGRYCDNVLPAESHRHGPAGNREVRRVGRIDQRPSLQSRWSGSRPLRELRGPRQQQTVQVCIAPAGQKHAMGPFKPEQSRKFPEHRLLGAPHRRPLPKRPAVVVQRGHKQVSEHRRRQRRRVDQTEIQRMRRAHGMGQRQPREIVYRRLNSDTPIAEGIGKQSSDRFSIAAGRDPAFFRPVENLREQVDGAPTGLPDVFSSRVRIHRRAPTVLFRSRSKHSHLTT